MEFFIGSCQTTFDAKKEIPIYTNFIEEHVNTPLKAIGMRYSKRVPQISLDDKNLYGSAYKIQGFAPQKKANGGAGKDDASTIEHDSD
jgi:hypothetical protein